MRIGLAGGVRRMFGLGYVRCRRDIYLDPAGGIDAVGLPLRCSLIMSGGVGDSRSVVTW